MIISSCLMGGRLRHTEGKPAALEEVERKLKVTWERMRPDRNGTRCTSSSSRRGLDG
jgi:hypothetical protein